MWASSFKHALIKHSSKNSIIFDMTVYIRTTYMAPCAIYKIVCTYQWWFIYLVSVSTIMLSYLIKYVALDFVQYMKYTFKQGQTGAHNHANSNLICPQMVSLNLHECTLSLNCFEDLFSMHKSPGHSFNNLLIFHNTYMYTALLSLSLSL